VTAVSKLSVTRPEPTVLRASNSTWQKVQTNMQFGNI